ncbi:MAG: ABC transporter substrate-binding protein [Halarcobacter sp.]
MKKSDILFTILFVFMVNSFALAKEKQIVDMANRTIIVPQKIENIVSVGGTPAINAFLFAFKKADIIQNGIENERLRKMPFWKHQQWFMPKLFELPQVSSNPPTWTPLFEKLALTKFDIALVNNPISAKNLENRAYKTAVINWHGENSIKNSMSFLGELFGMQEHAKEYINYYEKIENLVKDKTTNIKNKKSALYLRLDNLSMPMVTTANTIFEKAGVDAASKHITKEHVSIDMEKLFVLNPDYLFVWGKKDLKLAYNNPKFKDLKAVKNKNVFAVPMGAHFWTHYTPEQVLTILWVAKKAYPEQFKDINMFDETKKFYKKFMGKELTSKQINEILNI